MEQIGTNLPDGTAINPNVLVKSRAIGWKSALGPSCPQADKPCHPQWINPILWSPCTIFLVNP